MQLRLKLTVSSNPRLQPIFDGTVRPKDIELEIIQSPGRAAELFQHNLQADDFEVSEMFISETLISRERRDTFGKGRWDWSFIPVFFGRGLNWDRIFVRADSGIQSAADLKGKRLAVRDYSMTALVALRAMLKDLYGTEAGDITWYNLGTRGLETGLDKQPPRGVELHWLSSDADPARMLAAGELDAVHGLQSQPEGTRALFPEGPRPLAVEHYQKTGVQHINHHFVVQGRILREHPWIAESLYDAFAESGRVAIERARQYAPAYLYFEERDFKEQDRVFGEPYPSGIAANRPTLERLCKASFEQGLITSPVSVEDLYPASLHGT